jgi:hypothetical protein
MEFWRIFDNKIVGATNTNVLGFDIHSDYYIAPDEYIEGGKFLIFRTANGIGDWVMVEPIAKNLKHKYPNCEVYVASPKMIKDVLGFLHDRGWWKSWGDPSKTMEYMFKNNPYIDGFVDTWHTEVYHDHFRIYDSKNAYVTLAQQMLKFHHMDYDECIELNPMIYFDATEAKVGDSHLKNLPSDFEFLHISDRYTEKDTDILLSYIDDLNLSGKKFVTYYKGDIADIAFSKLNIVGNITHIEDPRIQFYVKSKAQNVIGVQTGATDVVSGHTQVHSLHHSATLEETLRKGNYIPNIKYIDRANYE